MERSARGLGSLDSDAWTCRSFSTRSTTPSRCRLPRSGRNGGITSGIPHRGLGRWNAARGSLRSSRRGRGRGAQGKLSEFLLAWMNNRPSRSASPHPSPSPSALGEGCANIELGCQIDLELRKAISPRSPQWEMEVWASADGGCTTLTRSTDHPLPVGQFPHAKPDLVGLSPDRPDDDSASPSSSSSPWSSRSR